LSAKRKVTEPISRRPYSQIRVMHACCLNARSLLGYLFIASQSSLLLHIVFVDFRN